MKTFKFFILVVCLSLVTFLIFGCSSETTENGDALLEEETADTSVTYDEGASTAEDQYDEKQMQAIRALEDFLRYVDLAETNDLMIQSAMDMMTSDARDATGANLASLKTFAKTPAETGWTYIISNIESIDDDFEMTVEFSTNKTVIYYLTNIDGWQVKSAK